MPSPENQYRSGPPRRFTWHHTGDQPMRTSPPRTPPGGNVPLVRASWPPARELATRAQGRTAMQLDPISATMLDDRCKGIPGGTAPFRLDSIAAKRWNVLREDLNLP